MANARRTWALSLGMLGIFLAGGLTGVFAAAGYLHHHLRALHASGPRAVHLLGVKWLDWELDLDDRQEASIEEILSAAHLELFQFKSRHNLEVRAMVLPALERIDAVLTPQQAERWSEIRRHVVEHVDATAETAPGH